MSRRPRFRYVTDHILKCTREYRPERRRDRVLSPLPGTDIIPLALYFSVSAEVDDAKLKSFFAAIDGKDGTGGKTGGIGCEI